MASSDIATPLLPGTKAPKFELPSGPDQTVSLAGLRGRPVILAFYPADWSPVCSDQMALYQAVLPEFQQFDAELLGISVDGVWSHLAFAKDRNLQFPLLADFEPKGEVARAYHVGDIHSTHDYTAAPGVVLRSGRDTDTVTVLLLLEVPSDATTSKL